MKILQKFLSKTHYFWFVSRILLILLFIFGVINQTDFNSKGNILVSSFFMLYVIGMIYLLIFEIIKKKIIIPIKFFVSVVSVLFGLLLVYLILTIGQIKNVINTIGILILPLWIILYGLWELKKENKIMEK